MSLRSWKRKLANAKKSVTETVGSAVDTVSEKASGLMDTTITLETAQEELIDDLEKGLRIFDEIGLKQEDGDALQEDIANYAMKKLEENFPKQESD
jgi:hypothetical protein